MQIKIRNLIENVASEDIRKITNEDDPKKSTRYKINIEEGLVKFSFTDLGENSHTLDIRRDEERYEFKLRLKLDDSSDIPEVKTRLSDLVNEVLPNQQNVINQDYPSGTLTCSNHLTKETVKNYLF